MKNQSVNNNKTKSVMNILTTIQSGNFPKLCFVFSWVNSYDVSKEEIVNKGMLFGNEEEMIQTVKELENGTHSDKFLNCELVHQYVGKYSGEPIAVSFTIHPTNIKVNENNSIDIDFNLSAEEGIYDNEMMCNVVNEMMVRTMDTIINEVSNEFDIEFSGGEMNVNTFVLR